MHRGTFSLVAILLCVYAVFGLAWLSLPGLEQDELLFLNISFPPDPVVAYTAKLQIFDWDVPIMLSPYMGATKGLLWRVLFLFWSPSVYAVRVPAVLLGGVALLLFYLWARRVYSQGTALAALALAATDPTYIFTARLDWGPVVLAHMFSFGGLLLGSCWLGERPGGNGAPGPQPNNRLRWLAGAGFCFGLGLWDKATFIWLLMALSVTLMLLFPRQVARRLRPAPMAVLLTSFLVGALPFVIYNVRNGKAGTVRMAHLQTFNGKALKPKWESLKTTLEARYGYAWMTGNAAEDQAPSGSRNFGPAVLAALSQLAPSWGTLLLWALAGAALAAALAKGARGPILFPLLVSAFMWAQMLPLKDVGWLHHIVLSYPLPHLAVAAAGAWLWTRGHRWTKYPLALALAGLLLSQLAWDARYLRAFRRTGGSAHWTDATYEIAAYLEASRPDLVVDMDWGFTYPLLLLTHARVRQQDFWGNVVFGDPAEETSRLRQLESLLSRPNTVFLFHTEAFQNYPGVRQLFDRALAQSGMRARVVRVFYQRTGEPIAVLVAAEAGRAAVPVIGP